MNTEALAARAEFYLMLSRAFLPPTGPDAHDAFVNALPGELRDTSEAAGYDNLQKIREYAAVAARVTDRTALLQIYSGLFLMPPREVPLHVSVFLDGTILGKSCDALELFYRKHGLARSEGFRDLPDHLSAVLEFLALLYARAAETGGYPRADLINDATELVRHFLLSWVPVMKRQLDRMQGEADARLGASSLPPIYSALAGLLQDALIVDAGTLSPALRQVLSPDAASDALREDTKEMAKCIDCGTDIAPVARVRRVRKVLEKEGIDSSHLDRCPKCRGIDIFPAGGNYRRV
jgi:TorA maturation chaperone TorD